MSILSDLAHFYDAKAEHYSETRKKHWHELDHILEWIKNSDKKELRIVELGCGDGRTFTELKKHTNKKIIYTGVDISQGLLDIAIKNSSHHKNVEWINSPMQEYVTKLEQESVDFFISFASFQHLTNEKTRLLTLFNINRALKYGGKHITFNRAFSKWFRKKMKTPILKAKLKHIFTLGHSDKYDILVPWSDQDKSNTYHRYYHMFRLKELLYLSKKSGFIVKICTYVSAQGKLLDTPDHARNSYLVQEKNISGDIDYQL